MVMLLPGPQPEPVKPLTLNTPPGTKGVPQLPYAGEVISKIETSDATLSSANELAQAFLGRQFSIVSSSRLAGDKAVIQAELRDLRCTIELIKDKSNAVNESGWLVQKQDCKPSHH
jgi:hypothetical protein